MQLPELSPLSAEETHGRAFRPENRLIAHSEGLGWRSLFAATYREMPYEGAVCAVEDDLLIYHLQGPASVSRHIGDGFERRACRPRQFTFQPREVSSEWLVEGDATLLHVYIRAPLLQELISALYDGDPARVSILPSFAIHDPLLEQLALNVVRAMTERPPGHALYVDCLAQAMASHLVQHHSTWTRTTRAPVPEAAWHWRMRRVAEYVEAHLVDDLALDAIADAAEIGPRHLTRSFKAAFGTTLHAYVVQRRIERAKELLRSTDLPVVAVALACGFSDQSKLGVAFRRAVGVTPGAYRREA